MGQRGDLASSQFPHCRKRLRLATVEAGEMRRTGSPSSKKWVASPLATLQLSSGHTRTFSCYSLQSRLPEEAFRDRVSVDLCLSSQSLSLISEWMNECWLYNFCKTHFPEATSYFSFKWPKCSQWASYPPQRHGFPTYLRDRLSLTLPAKADLSS